MLAATVGEFAFLEAAIHALASSDTFADAVFAGACFFVFGAFVFFGFLFSWSGVHGGECEL